MSRTGKLCRFVRGLQVAAACDRPAGLPRGRARGAKALGLRYERELAKALPNAAHGQWFRFVDAGGPGYCQTDLLLRTEYGIAILEAKYTWTEAGHYQIERLYVPVVEKAYPGQPAFGLVVCKTLTAEVNPEWVCRDLKSAIFRAASGRKTVLHWIGVGLEPLRIAA